VNSIKLYHEVYGQGETLVLIPGRLTTIGEIERWVQGPAKTRPMIAVEMQGHGRTADTDRPMSFATMGKLMTEDYDWSAEIARLVIPVLLVFADNDSVSQKHIAEFFALLGGGLKEPGWLNTQLSKSRLAVVPGYSHYNFIASAEVPQIVSRFLADPLTNPPTGAAPASRAASDVKS